MFFVYYKYLESGRSECCGVYSNAKDAIEKIRALYNIDSNNNQLGEYYYFYAEH